MSKGTEVAKITRVSLLGPLVAELLLILLRVVKRLHSVVSLRAGVFLGTAACLCELAHLRRVRTKGPPSIFVVIVDTLLLVVTVFFRARFSFELSQVQVGYAFTFLDDRCATVDLRFFGLLFFTACETLTVLSGI